MILKVATRAIAAFVTAVPVVASGIAGAPLYAHPAQAIARPGVVKILSLVGDPLHPATVYIGGSAANPDSYNHGFYGYWRSTDSGATWSDLSRALGLGQTFTGHDDPTDPTSDPIYGQTSISTFSLAPDGSYLLASAYHQPANPGTGYSQLIRSTDGGLSWAAVPGEQGEYGNGQYNPVISPASPQRAYSVDSSGDFAGSAAQLQTSSDGGRTFRATGDVSKLAGEYASLDTIIADPTHATTVYGGYADKSPGNESSTLQWLSSDDAGTTWSRVITPTDSPALSSFTLATDSHLPGLLVASTTTEGLPAYRRYLSRDEGATWKLATCPGDLGGSCPRATVENVFGAGASYGLYADGIHPFHLGGPAGARLAVSDALPVSISHVASVFAGTHAGDPVYLLSDDTAGAKADQLYRSGDAGKTWQLLATNLLPNQAPPSSAPGSLLVRATKHSVAAPFVAFYRTLGLHIIGYPVTEAYLQSNILTQDFEHLRLQVRHGKVVPAPWGIDVYHYGTTVEEPDPRASVLVAADRPIAQAPTGKFAAFWQAHGGLAVFGAPITLEFDSENRDRTGHTYTMQYFQNARLELHSESKDPAYRIVLGLLGQESLVARGWVMQPS